MAAAKSILKYNYSVDPDQSIARRLAAFLHWAANTVPARAIPLQHAAKIVLIMPRVTGPDSREVQSIKSAIPRARKILLEEYKRGLVSVSGMGIRATIDDDDLVQEQVEKDSRRVVSAHEALSRSSAAVKMNKIQDVELKKRFMRITKASRTLANPISELRLPSKKDKKG